jgi:hypothetical protein
MLRKRFLAGRSCAEMESFMRRRRRRFWLAAVLALAAVAVVAIHVAVDQLTREPPNYSRIEDGLWLGGRVAQPPPATQTVLNLCELEDPYSVPSQRWEPIRDGGPAPPLTWLREQVGFIDSERAAGHTVFVHCRNGISRSGFVVVAYLMRREGWSRDEALAFVRKRRPGVRPNAAFLQLLLEWESSLRD